MALTKTMSDALNKQFNEELNSAYLYESMAADFYAKNLSGFAVWMTSQAGEERLHAEKIHHYLDENGERVLYAAIPEPQAEWKSPLATIQAALGHERYITKSIHDLVRTARKEDDIATETFLSWYVTEQIEEEATAQSLIDKLEMVGDNRVGLYQLDKEVSTRQQDA
jgi:ferritin